MHVWMREGQYGGVQYQIIIQKYVDVDLAWTIAECCPTSQRYFEALDMFEQRFRLQIGLCFHYLV